MKVFLLFVLLCAVCCLAMAVGPRRGGHGRRQGANFRGRGPLGKKKFMKKINRVHTTMEGGALIAGISFVADKSNGKVPSYVLRQLKACSRQCHDDCIEFSTCKDTCPGRCQDVLAPGLCKRNCYANHCITRNCSACHKTCVREAYQCATENCKRECSPRMLRKPHLRARCERCMTTECSSNGEETGSDTEVDPLFGRNPPSVAGNDGAEVDPLFGRNPPTITENNGAEVDPLFGRNPPSVSGNIGAEVDPHFGRNLPSVVESNPEQISFLQAVVDVVQPGEES